MAHFFRLLTALFVCMFLHTSALAVFPKTAPDETTCAGTSNAIGATACKNSIQSSGYVYQSYDIASKQCFYTGGLWTTCTASKGLPVCPANSTVTADNQCQCSSGFTESNGTCAASTTSLAATAKAVCDGLNYLKQPVSYDGAPMLTTCYAGVEVTGSGAVGGGGKTEVYGPFTCVATNAGCTTKAAAGSGCPVGSFPGTVNGMAVCSPPENTISTGEKETTTTAGGLGAGTPSDAVSSTTTTTCTGAASCTTTTTYNNAAGSPVGTKQEIATQAAFCVEHPADAMCKAVKPAEEKTGTFSGTCTAPPVCTGDPLQCAIAKATFETKCGLDSIKTDSQNATVQKGTRAFTGQIDSADNARGQKTTKDLGTFDQSSPFNTASMTDSTIVLGGPFRPIVIPWSSMNGVLQMMGSLLVGLTLLSSAFFVVKGTS